MQGDSAAGILMANPVTSIELFLGPRIIEKKCMLSIFFHREDSVV